MGGLLSKKDEDKLSDAINKKLHADGKKLKTEIKLLLLGTGESGKSTFAKQLKILHMSGFSKEELMHYKNVLHSNVIAGITALVESCEKMNLAMNPSIVPMANKFIGLDSAAPLTPELVASIKQIWPDPAIQLAYERRAEFQLHGSVPYVVQNIDRISEPTTIPTDDDVIQCRVRTTGIVELIFELEKVSFRVMDVGGQRSERRKWIHCFQGVTAVLFCVALSEYDEKLCEDTKVNRMHEAIQLFEDISNNQFFCDSAIILFLNKSDLFEEKVKKIPLKVCFPDYTGEDSFDEGTKYIEKQFLDKVHDKEKLVYTHITCATNTENVRHVFDDVRSIVIETNLKLMKF